MNQKSTAESGLSYMIESKDTIEIGGHIVKKGEEYLGVY